VGNSEKIIEFKLSPVTQHHLYIITSTGHLSQWDWISGKQVAKWVKRSKILIFDISPVVIEKKMQIACFFLYDLGHGRREVAVNLLDEITSPKRLDDVVILGTSKPINTMKIVQGGRVLIVSDDKHLLIGRSSASSFGCAESLIYTWRVVMLPVTITSLDVRESKAAQSIKSTIPGNPTGGPGNIDLVVGEQGGSILIYDDILKTFSRNEEEYLPILRKLHWHRDAVSVVRWSRDGEFIMFCMMDTEG
jgi:NET1-associated nuclear protein 1 (U3 small nucleolar RNA-associated protein 17)